ncbi:hypothetical protein Pan258_17080 [Symmachiella dynata]|uniref:Uncharacterized protein n=1 Tax=Symmachiella dynata TaxID=2527995 RepID=A0A517ZLF3_9PLAN|nr:hypothetical protein [Symmachiella dynata]QDT47672.1 hypothetical protein Pan258_17080 [Symmachiella dynata]QDU43255.1 hypothetical protein Mal52_17270 [Symmachiella dynata]
MRYVYIFLRVLVAAAVATDVYRLFDPKYLIGQISTAIFGLTLAVIILLARRKDVRRIVRGTVTCLLCTFATGSVAILLFTYAVQPPWQPGDDLRNFISGFTVGMIVAIGIIARREPD